MTASELATRVGAKRNGKEYRAICPAHPDHDPSLDFRDGDKGIVFTCRSRNCEPGAIVSAFGLCMSDVMPERTTTEQAKTRHFVYTDEHGAPLIRSARREPGYDGKRKSIWQEHITPGGAWAKGTDGVRRVPYRLHELQGQTTAYIPEGEPHCDRLAALGLPATCNIGGAEKWRDEDTAAIVSAGVQHVVLLTDNDGPGRAHGELVARSCHAAGLKVKVVALPGLPEKGDILDWLDSGHTKDELIAIVRATAMYVPGPTTATEQRAGRVLRLTPASHVAPRPVRWLWEGRLALGTFSLLGGREGIGKSIVECTLTADITRGRLPGVYYGIPRAVIIAATEDSWEYTIVPRLMAAGADLDLVFRVDVETTGGIDTALSLPRDLPAVERLILEQHVAVLMLDPILSRLEAELDSHKDGEVRQALEPLVAMLERTSCSALGLIHVNKSTSNDPLTTLMASRAFTAVARAVLFVMVDPDDDTTRLLGQPKNNLGRSDLPTLAFQIEGAKVAETDEGPVWTGKLQWTGETDRSIRDALQQTAETAGSNRTAVTEAAEWLEDFLTSKGGSADSTEVKQQGAKAGHAVATIQRARTKLKIATTSVGFPRQTHWALVGSQSSQPVVSTPGENDLTDTTETTAAKRTIPNETTSPQLSQSSQSSQSFHTPREVETTARPAVFDSSLVPTRCRSPRCSAAVARAGDLCRACSRSWGSTQAVN